MLSTSRKTEALARGGRVKAGAKFGSKWLSDLHDSDNVWFLTPDTLDVDEGVDNAEEGELMGLLKHDFDVTESTECPCCSSEAECALVDSSRCLLLQEGRTDSDVEEVVNRSTWS